MLFPWRTQQQRAKGPMSDVSGRFISSVTRGIHPSGAESVCFNGMAGTFADKYLKLSPSRCTRTRKRECLCCSRSNAALSEVSSKGPRIRATMVTFNDAASLSRQMILSTGLNSRSWGI